MANTTQKVNLLQTAYNVAGTVTAALVNAGVTKDAQGALEAIKAEVFKDLEAVHASEPAPTPAPRRAYGGGGGSSDLDPGTVKLSEKYKKYPGKTIAEVYAMDQSYIRWLAKSDNPFIKERAAAYLAKVSGTNGAAAEPQDQRSDPSYF